MDSRVIIKRTYITALLLILVTLAYQAVPWKVKAGSEDEAASNIDLVFITLDDVVCSDTLRIDIAETPYLQFGYTLVPGDVVVKEVNWSLTSVNPEINIDNFASVDKAGKVSFFNPTPIGESLILTCSVNGVNSEPVKLDLRINTPELEQIRTRYNPLYVSSELSSIDIFDNLAPVPSDALLSARSAVASVDNKAFNINNGSGILRFNGSGETEANVYIESLENPQVNTSFKIIRTAPKKATGLSAEKEIVFASDSAPVNVKARLMPVDTTESLDFNFTYESENPNVVTVDSNGFATPVGNGTTAIVITATDPKGDGQNPIVYTTKTEVNVIHPIPIQGISVDKSLIELTTIPTGKTHEQLDVHLDPVDTTQTKLTYTSLAPTVAMVDENGVIAALAEGKTTVVIKDEADHETLVQVNVSNNKIVTDYVTITALSPDEFTVIAKNVHTNPALSLPSSQIETATAFAFSDKPTKGDLNAKRMEQEPGTSDWKMTFPINNTGVNNFFDNACKIQVHIYASNEQNQDGELIGFVLYDYVSYGTSPTNLTVTPFVENLGFITPSVGSDSIAGTLGKGLQMEGIRIASPVNDISLSYQVHAAGIGWMGDVEEGVYAGTMGEHRALEAIKINMDGPSAGLYHLTYRAYVRDLGWTNWVLAGEEAGTTGMGKQIEAVQLSLEKKEF